MDGVLSDAGGRQHYLDGPYRDWDAFFESCGDDLAVEEMLRLLDVIDPRHAVVLLTARPIWVQPQTLQWLDRHGVRWDLLVMRDWGDYEVAREFKRRTVHELRGAGFSLELAFEDDQRNCEMFRDEDIPCVYIHSGYYE